MKLLTYNFLTSKCIKKVKVGYPLRLNVSEQKVEQQNFNPEFIQRMLPRLDWSTIKMAADSVGFQGLPEEVNIETSASDTELLQKLHHLLLEIQITEGSLICPETNRVFPINNGIPNMLLNEDEV